MNSTTTTTTQPASYVHGGSHTTRTVHLATVGGYDGARLVRACGMNRRDSAYLYATDEAVTCKRCLALEVEAATQEQAEAADLDAAELDALIAQEDADLEAYAAERADQLEAVRRIYGNAAAELVVNGWTVDSAASHVTGVCDLELCTGDHDTAWAIMVAEATGRPEAAQAEREAELARSLAAVREAAVAAGRQDVADALEAMIVPTCQWFAGCGRPATGTTPHPILGAVPTCDRCAEFAGGAR